MRARSLQYRHKEGGFDMSALADRPPAYEPSSGHRITKMEGLLHLRRYDSSATTSIPSISGRAHSPLLSDAFRAPAWGASEFARGRV